MTASDTLRAVAEWNIGDDPGNLLHETIRQDVAERQAVAFVSESELDGSASANIQVTLEATQAVSSLTFASKMGPSSDWFIGVSALSLFEEGQWRDGLTIDLVPIDAGTRDGSAFQPSETATTPFAPVRRLDTDEASPFDGLPTVAQLSLSRILVCEFNGDEICNAQDLSTFDGLYSVGDLEVGVAVSTASPFDLNSDGIVDSRDLDQWLADAAKVNGFAEPYLKGDTNLNDHVGFGDFTAMSRQFGTGREWTEGNYRGAGTTSFPDFLSLSDNFGKQIPRAAQTITPSVREPSVETLLGILLLSICVLRSSWKRIKRKRSDRRKTHDGQCGHPCRTNNRNARLRSILTNSVFCNQHILGVQLCIETKSRRLRMV